MHDVYTLFFELSTCRTEGLIPWTAIHTCAQAYGFANTPEEFNRFLQLIRGMDQKYVEIKNKKQPASSVTGDKPTRPERGGIGR